MSTQPPLNVNLLFPLTSEQLARLKEVIIDFDTNQLAWLSGYFWGIGNNHIPTNLVKLPDQTIPIITLISASQTGNARRIAEQLYNDLLMAKLKVNLINAGNYNYKKINQEKIILLVTSTQGEGEPPEEALSLYKFLMSKRAPKFKNTLFAIFGLGDASYKFFSKAGQDFDLCFATLGAERLLDRVDADLDYDKQASTWRKQITKILKNRLLRESSIIPNMITTSDSLNVDKINCSLYTKENPLIAKVIVNQKITGRYSNKDIHHIEIDLGTSGLHYKPGDAVGIWYENDIELIKELMELVCLNGDEIVEVYGQNLTLKDSLQKYFELTVNTPLIIKNYAVISCNKFLTTLTSDHIKLKTYAQNFPIVDMIRKFPTTMKASQLISLLRPLTPRFYSISSSQLETDSEVHITVSAVRYKIDGYIRGGGASTWLIDRIKEDDSIRLFIQQNNNFRLPLNPNSSIIMIASGTGIAPFRAFMQQRDNDGANGKNWLFFGNPHFLEDFLYQIEWQRYFKKGLLTNIDLAWSRDQNKKIYIQDKIRLKGKEIWKWIQDGAYLYVCGAINNMAKEVEQALLDILIKYGNMNNHTSNDFLNDLRVERRYQRDVY
ncbi:NADPH-dependent assimilatory sulfite reductase flavoprotein subunit [Pantoea sp. Aalb]|uniref:NADPH-dependent assimilatory sulfite reductase flavoprotein subunit n=1 Tax=Pantoea sp. Aalb TaxID=2576762 RepID=UPI001325B668|nr:NADPH-dependent assimilatory sulfite reductase flavoprotein subunit [Pantoea sp. Aalb]MXP67756.1 NADPH-dependent assimilatory sulfite reductase flavoprotein subunit [Pantoea sp. Aalb]